MYANPQLNPFWTVDYRSYDPSGDGKTKLDPVQDMLQKGIYQKCLKIRAVLMDSWYATKGIMLQLEQFKKIYGPLKSNRPVDDSGGFKPDQRVDSLAWTNLEQQYGKTIKIKRFPAKHPVKLFRVVWSIQRTDSVVINEIAQNHVAVVPEGCSFRWQVEPFHRETKQLTGIEGSQCPTARIVRNHIGCSILVWVRLKQVAVETNRTLYRVKHDLLDDYLCQQLKSPTVQMCLA